jgi:hypothetical protein
MGAYLLFLSVSLSTVQLRSQWSGLRMLWIHSISISLSELYWHSLSLQVRLFATQSHYADRLAEAVSNINCPSFLSISVLHLCISIGSLPSFRGLTVGLGSKALHNSKLFTPVICTIQERSENQCTSQLKSLIDQVSMQQEKIVALEGTNTLNLHLHVIFFWAL